MSFIKTNQRAKSGFSMIELLVVATIMIVLTTIGLVSYQNANRNGRNAKRKADLEAVRQGLVLYKTDNSTSYPSGDFSTMLTTIADYLSSTNIQDPKSPTYDYTYSSSGTSFQVCATLEVTGGTQNYCLDSP